jgi:thioredoxin reductase
MTDIDFDVAIVGGGLAGLSAAVRARWVKGHGAVPLQAGVFEPGVPGGLAAWRGIYMTGPGFYLKREEITQRLLADCDLYEIPILPERVQEVVHRQQCWHLRTAAGREYRASALILATGLRPQGREGNLFAHGVYLTYMGYDHLYRLFRQIPKTRGTDHPILVVGNEHTGLLSDVFRDILAETRASFRFLLDDPTQISDLPGEVLIGRYADVEAEGALLRVAYHDEAGRTQGVTASAVIIDYNAFELRPSFAVSGDIPRNEHGFVEVDSMCRTPAQFLYAAGDITGGYAMALKALTQGALAGFAAYEDLYRSRFDGDPVMFAYKPKATPIHKGFRALPTWKPMDCIKPLVSRAKLRAVGVSEDSPQARWLASEGFRFSDLVAAFGHEGATSTLDEWLERKVVTVRRSPGATE